MGALNFVMAITTTAIMGVGPAGHDPVQAALDSAVNQAGAPGIAAEIRDGRHARFSSAGVSDLDTGRPRQPDERFRIGSTTKAFTAAVVLQLAGEHRLSLDDSVEKWLPGLVDGNGYDGSRITVWELLNHTSGIFSYTNDKDFFANGIGAAFFVHRYDHYDPEQLVRIALATPPYAPPGQVFTYSNTDSILAAMIVEKATGHSFTSELTRRIIRPLGLTGTSLPGDDPTIHGPHPVLYSTLFSGDPHPAIYDATDMNQSFAWSAGGMISTLGDLNRFFGALLGGRLLRPAEQRELFTTVATSGWIPHTRYGLGIFAQTLTCGVTVWGHGGATYGSWSYVMGDRRGHHLIAVSVNGDWAGLTVFNNVLDAEFCPAAN